MTGIYSVNVDYNQQKVTVWGICNKYDVLTTMRSKRKEARFWNPDDNIALEESESSSPSPSPPSNDYISKISMSKHSLALTKVRSFSWKAMKKVFIRSYSFWYNNFMHTMQCRRRKRRNFELRLLKIETRKD